jgi:hypothetical protein
MSNSAFTNFLASLRAPSDTPRAPLGGEPNAKLIGVPLNVRDEVIAERRSVRVQGEVVQTKPDGTVRVRTERGDIEIKISEGQRPPAEGQKIEIEIPPNVNAKKSPDIVIYRRLPDQTPQSSDPRTTGTPVEVRVDGQSPPVRAQPTQQPVPTQPQSFPSEGTAIRLQPLPPQIQNALTPYVPLEQFTVTLAPVSDAKLQTIVNNAQNDLSGLLQTIKPSAPVTLTPLSRLTLLDSLSPMGRGTVPQSVNAGKQGEGVAIFFPTTSSQSTPLTQKTILKNFTETLPKLPAQLIQKIAFGSLKPELNTTSQTANTPLQVVQKIQALDVTLTGKTEPILELKTQNLQTQIIPSNAENIILQNQKAGTITGVVTNFTQSQLPIIDVFFPQTGATQTFTLQFPTSQITVGSSLIFTPQTSTNPQGATQISPTLLPLPLQLAPGAWPVIDEIYQTLTQTHPPVAQAMATITPSPTSPAQMSPAMLFFVAAVRGGDLTQWLSDKTIDALKSTGKSSLLSRLTQEGSNLSRLASETLSQDWRALNLPMLYQGDMQKIVLYYRNEYNESANEKNGKTLNGTRFVFDLNLDAMGKVQLDGLFRPVSDAGKRLDLVVRTEQFFSQATQGEMRRVYARALRDTGVTGELLFQNKPESWVMVSGENTSSLSMSS